MSNNENKSGRPSKNEKTPFTSIFRKLVGVSTQQEIADKIGTSRQNVGKWLSGTTSPDIAALGKIANAYNVSTDYLLGLNPNTTTDMKLKAVCKYTGLSEKAINNIVKLYGFHIEDKENSETMTLFDFVNIFLSDYETLRGVSAATAKYVNKLNVIIKEIAENEKLPDELIIKNADKLFFELTDKLQFEKWRAVKAFEWGLEIIVDDYKTQGKGGDPNAQHNPPQE